jgi:hypothetical protein
MCNHDNDELRDLIRGTGEQLEENWCLEACEFLADRGIGYGYAGVPIEIFKGVLRAVADASGYRIVLQTSIVEPVENSDVMRTVGHREIANLEPTLWVVTEPTPKE